MNNCPECNHELVNIIYGFPTPKLVELARSEGIALGGTILAKDMPTHYCYGCHEVFPKIEEITYEDASPLFSE